MTVICSLNILRSDLRRTTSFVFFSAWKASLMLKASPDLGKWYLQNIYANLMMRMKFHLDWARDGEKGIQNLRKDVFAFVKSMTKAEEYQAVTRECFVELAGHVSRRRRGNKEKAKAQIPEDGKLFHLIGAPPPPPPLTARLSLDLLPTVEKY